MERRTIEDLVARWLDGAIRDGNIAIFDDLLIEDVRDLSGPMPTCGREPFRRRASAVHAAFSDIQTTLDGLVVELPCIAWRWSVVGTHRASFAGVAATGRRVTLRGVNFQRLEAGRIVEHWTLADLHGLGEALR
jgi:predicted ester cyclase